MRRISRFDRGHDVGFLADGAASRESACGYTRVLSIAFLRVMFDGYFWSGSDGIIRHICIYRYIIVLHQHLNLPLYQRSFPRSNA